MASDSVQQREACRLNLSGDHGAIRRWRLKQSLGRTWQRRPELLEKRELNDEQRGLLEEFIAEAQAGGNE